MRRQAKKGGTTIFTCFQTLMMNCSSNYRPKMDSQSYPTWEFSYKSFTKWLYHKLWWHCQSLIQLKKKKKPFHHCHAVWAAHTVHKVIATLPNSSGVHGNRGEVGRGWGRGESGRARGREVTQQSHRGSISGEEKHSPNAQTCNKYQVLVQLYEPASLLANEAPGLSPIHCNDSFFTVLQGESNLTHFKVHICGMAPFNFTKCIHLYLGIDVKTICDWLNVPCIVIYDRSFTPVVWYERIYMSFYSHK